ncbi:N-acetylmannosamine-6-phosphate 2-epimerase [Bacillus sp. JJ1533]|uniref:N-acetylmannosamine-6-phosphate 2-epimerase n=1 Tax=Bacillus sp. JJ1533 TaxID=3122959 RepID=UPI0030000239
MIELLKKKLIVSCQAWPGTPFYGDPRLIRAMAESAYIGGAGGIRANGVDDIQEIKKNVPLPIIGIYKLPDKRGKTVITPDFESAQKIADAGSDIIAIDASIEARPDIEELQQFIYKIKTELRMPVMADISDLDEAIRAEASGVDIVATTMAGYTPYSKKTDGPDLDLLESIVKKVKIPVIGEGRFSKPEEVNEAINVRRAHSVVIGTSITAPWEITNRFVRAI